jgi:hypothetical protein
LVAAVREEVVTDKTIPPICERLEELAAFSEAANGNHLYGVHPNNAARAFTEARETIIALVSAMEKIEQSHPVRARRIAHTALSTMKAADHD